MSDRAIRTSESLANIAPALVAAKAEFPKVTRNKRADIGNYGYNYADLANVFDAVDPVLASHGLVVIQPPGMVEAAGVIVTLLLHTSGEWIESTFPVQTFAKPQETGSAITYIRRYCVVATLGIATEEDDDGAAAQNSGADKPKKAKAKKDDLPDPANVPAIDIAKKLRAEVGKVAADEGLTDIAARLLAEWFGEGKTSQDLDPTQLRSARKGLELYGSNLRTVASLGDGLNLADSDVLLVAADVVGSDDTIASLRTLTSKHLADLVIELKTRATQSNA